LADIAALTAIIEPEARALGFDLVRVAWFGGTGDRTLQIMAERPATRQLTIDDCADLSRRISERIDALEADGKDICEEAYRLEVSSPGIDRPLTRLSDFADWASHEAKVELSETIEGRKRIQGTISSVDGETITITARKGDVFAFPFAAVDSAKLVLTDRLISATVPLSTVGADDIQTEAQED
jgi:ribosome maturation factor RimP